MQEIALIFGGSGFIGSHLIDSLVREGRYKVVSVDRRAPRKRLPDVTYLEADVRNLAGLAIDGTVQIIYNLAAVHTTPGHPEHEYYETNISGANEILAFARRHNVRQIVFTSSISVYGPSEELKTEDSEPNPTSAYGWSKLLAERMHLSWLNESADNRLVVVRPAVVFGPFEGGNFTRLAKMLKKGYFVYPGRTDTIKSCIYVFDLLEAISFALSQEDRFVLFNGAYPERYTISEIVRTFRTEHFPHVKTFVFPRPLMMLAAGMLAPLSRANIGVHPERILKLVRSTNIQPLWLETNGAAKTGRLSSALKSWHELTSGSFD